MRRARAPQRGRNACWMKVAWLPPLASHRTSMPTGAPTSYASAPRPRISNGTRTRARASRLSLGFAASVVCVLTHLAPRFQCFALDFLPGLLRLSFEVLTGLPGFLFDLLAGFLELLPGLADF